MYQLKQNGNHNHSGKQLYQKDQLTFHCLSNRLSREEAHGGPNPLERLLTRTVHGTTRGNISLGSNDWGAMQYSINIK